MTKYLLAAASAVGITLATAAPAKALVPLAIAGIAVGAGLLGLFTGNAMQQQYQYQTAPVYTAPDPSAPGFACYLKRRHGRLIQVCE